MLVKKEQEKADLSVGLRILQKMACETVVGKTLKTKSYYNLTWPKKHYQITTGRRK